MYSHVFWCLISSHVSSNLISCILMSHQISRILMSHLISCILMSHLISCILMSHLISSHLMYSHVSYNLMRMVHIIIIFSWHQRHYSWPKMVFSWHHIHELKRFDSPISPPKTGVLPHINRVNIFVECSPSGFFFGKPGTGELPSPQELSTPFDQIMLESASTVQNKTIEKSNRTNKQNNQNWPLWGCGCQIQDLQWTWTGNLRKSSKYWFYKTFQF